MNTTSTLCAQHWRGLLLGGRGIARLRCVAASDLVGFVAGADLLHRAEHLVIALDVLLMDASAAARIRGGLGDCSGMTTLCANSYSVHPS